MPAETNGADAPVLHAADMTLVNVQFYMPPETPASEITRMVAQALASVKDAESVSVTVQPVTVITK